MKRILIVTITLLIALTVLISLNNWLWAQNEESENKVGYKCPNCGNKKLFDQGEDEYFLICYGSGYWEKDYYSPSGLIKVNICSECGTVYLPINPLYIKEK